MNLLLIAKSPGTKKLPLLGWDEHPKRWWPPPSVFLAYGRLID